MPALVLGRRGEFDAALALCRTAAQAGGDRLDMSETGQVALGLVMASGRKSEIIQQADGIFEAAQSHAPNDDALVVMRAMLYHLTANFDEEVRSYRSVLARQPRNLVVLNNLAWPLSEGLKQPSEGLEKIDDLIRLGGRSPEGVDTRGGILTRLSRFDEAIKDLQEVIQAAPNGVHLFHLANAYSKAGRADESRKIFEQAQKAGLKPEELDPSEVSEFQELMASQTKG